MKVKDNKKIIILVAIAIFLILGIANIALGVTSSIVDTSLKGSVSMTVYEYVNGVQSNKRVL